ncbi:MAG: cytochrome-c peroxidase, partial [Armatimonadota bacterium]
MKSPAPRWIRWVAGIAPVIALGLAALPGQGSSRKARPQVEPPPPLAPLNSVAVPLPDLGRFVKDNAAAIRLGKALFWDMQAGSDGTACASCHYQAGSDGRDRNQLSPAFDSVFDSAHTVNYQLTLADFPFTQFRKILDNRSQKLRNSNDIVGSQGLLQFAFQGLSIDAFGNIGAYDIGIPIADQIFNLKGVNTRQVTGRNAPSVINAIYNHRNFWDGRAHNEFNGVNPFGDSDVDARVYRTIGTGDVQPTRISIRNASLASQAVGPLNNQVEMAFGGRNFAQVARKLLGVKPLALQAVAPDDSVLGTFASPSKGLSTTYRAMIQAAFDDRWWNSAVKFTVNGRGRIVPDAAGAYSHMEANFSLFFGLAVLAYEATLVSGDTPYDRYLAGQTNAMSASAIRGLAIFQNQNCNVCHRGATLSNATVPEINAEAAALGIQVPVELMLMADGLPSAYDAGYYNLGVRPTAEDIGIGANDPFGNPLSFSRSLQLGLITDPNRPADQLVDANTRLDIMGAFKVPGLR